MKLILYRICLWSANCLKRMNAFIQRWWRQIIIICVPLHSLIWKCIFHSNIIKASILNLKVIENNSAEFKLIKNSVNSSYTSESSLTFVIFTEWNLQIYSENCVKIWVLCSVTVLLCAQKIAWFLKYSGFSDVYCRFFKQ